jgi:hypothetical protein
MPTMPDRFIGVDVETRVCFFTPVLGAFGALNLDLGSYFSAKVYAKINEGSHA